jgi:hypothetical protein
MRCVLAQHFTIRKALRWRSAIEEHPPYQRESAIWTLAKQQLFIDSILNGYDIPKLYLHDLRGEHPTKVYSIVDGRQRLTTLWAFLADDVALADDFRIEPRNEPDLPADAVTPRAGQRFSELDRHWRKLFEETYLSVVLIRNATEEDIEDLFSRLNNGEPLNAAEKRNAMGGDAVRLIRDVVARPFFTERLSFPNGRHRHHALAARVLAIELARRDGTAGLPDLDGAALDALVRTHRRIEPAERTAVLDAIDDRLADMERVFGSGDPLLGTPSQALLAYLLIAGRPMDGPAAATALRAALDRFAAEYAEALDHPGDAVDETLLEFSERGQPGTNDARDLERRLELLGRFVDRAASEAASVPPAGPERS